jgi:hypothetical protein
MSPSHYDTMGMGSRSGAPSKLFVGGVSAHTTTEALRGHFSKYGRIIDAVVMQKNGRPRGFGFVTFDHQLPAECALAEPQWLDGRLVDVKRAVPGERAQERASNKIFVGGLPQDVSTDELRAYFSGYGPVADAVVMVDRRTNRSRGFGFIRFGNGSQGNTAAEAVLMDFASHCLAGKWVEVKRATPASQLQEMFPYEGVEDEMYCGMSPEDLFAIASMGMIPDYSGFAGWDSSPCSESTPMSMLGLDVSSGASARSRPHGRRARRRNAKQRFGEHKAGSNGDIEDCSDDESSPMSLHQAPLGEVAFVATANGKTSPANTVRKSSHGQSEARALGPITVSELAERLLVAGPSNGSVGSGNGAGTAGKTAGAPTASENDPSRANTTTPADQPMKVNACRDKCFTREDFLSLEVRPWLSAW